MTYVGKVCIQPMRLAPDMIVVLAHPVDDVPAAAVTPGN